MVDGLLFCATLTSRRGGHTPYVKAGAETSDTTAEAVKPDPGSWKGHCARVGVGVGDESGCPPILHSIDDPPSVLCVCSCQKNW